MHKRLIIQAFEKAESSRVKLGEKKPSLVNIAEDLSNYIYKEEGFSIGERSFRDYRNEAEKLKLCDEDINIKQFKVVLGLCHYLGCLSYDDFISKNNLGDGNKGVQRTKKELGPSVFFAKHKITLIVSVILLLGFIAFQSINKQRWMVWQDDHYIEVGFDAKKYNLGQLKLYNGDRIKDFRKITPNCDMPFFDSQGHVTVWYGKNNRKELEYFTALGLHPETGKSLDPITVYMIKKYICPNY